MYLGAGVDDELDGQPDQRAWGDDQNDTPDDEDGVAFEDFIGTPALPIAIMQPGDTATLTISGVYPTTTDPFSTTNGYLQAWIDWNGDGDWIDPGEQVIMNRVFNGYSDRSRQPATKLNK